MVNMTDSENRKLPGLLPRYGRTRTVLGQIIGEEGNIQMLSPRTEDLLTFR
jgi:hypothetical protein